MLAPVQSLNCSFFGNTICDYKVRNSSTNFAFFSVFSISSLSKFYEFPFYTQYNFIQLIRRPHFMAMAAKAKYAHTFKFSVCSSVTSGLVGVSSQNFFQTTCREPGVVGTIFGRPAPKIWEVEKKRPKSGAISNNFRLWSRISPERIHKSTDENLVDQLQHLTRWAKKVGKLWSTNEKVIDVSIDPPKWTLFGRLYFRAYGLLRRQFFTRAIDWPGLASAHPNGYWGPKKCNRENLKFGLKFSVCASITSGLVGVSSQFFKTTCREPGVITWVQFIKSLPPKIWEGENKPPKFGAMSDNFRLWLRLSPERIDKSKIGTVVDQLQPLPRCTKKYGELWSTNEKVTDVHIDPRKRTFFRRLYFGP